MNNEKYTDVILTEVGVFGTLNIEDPTFREVKKKKENDTNIDDLIAQSINENASIRI